MWWKKKVKQQEVWGEKKRWKGKKKGGEWENNTLIQVGRRSQRELDIGRRGKMWCNGKKNEKRKKYKKWKKTKEKRKKSVIEKEGKTTRGVRRKRDVEGKKKGGEWRKQNSWTKRKKDWNRNE
jgi:hypothetical protein